MPGDYLSEALADDQKLLMSGSYIEVKPQPFMFSGLLRVQNLRPTHTESQSAL